MMCAGRGAGHRGQHGSRSDEQVARRSAAEERDRIAPSTVGAYKIGKRRVARPRVETLRKLARGLGVPPERLFAAAGLLEPEARPGADERLLVELYRRLPTKADREQALDTLRAHVRSASRR